MSKNVTDEINDLLAAEQQAEAGVPASGGKAPKAPKAPKVPKEPKAPEGPNPYGIRNRAGLVITTSYLKKYAQCATRGLRGSKGTPFSRNENINYFMSEEFLEKFRGGTTGEYSQACKYSDRWGDEKPVRAVRVSKVKAVATPEEQAIIDTPPLY